MEILRVVFFIVLFCFSLTWIRKISSQLPLFLTPPQDILESLMEHALGIYHKYRWVQASRLMPSSYTVKVMDRIFLEFFFIEQVFKFFISR